MDSRRGIGRTEVIIGIAVVAVVALITLPLWLNTSRKSGRAEVPLNVDAIKLAEVTYNEAFDEFVSAEAAPRATTAVNTEKVAWAPSPGFVKLAWEPEEKQLYGSYMVVARDDDFTVTGTCDLDGDGQRAVFTANATDNATMTTDESIY
ncbi:MAG: type II secretion system protein [Deltaproteobacteria bacterium]|nr:type II secretion system protein [Deltaproteobacteria bacterium]MBW2253345.1 type II secretion system protein [Deltaproteobacteria bacterium]